MRKNLIVSIIIIAISVTLIGGATLAWFTNATTPIENEFTAGTVEISADETVTPPIATMENWNPGDVAEKEFTIINEGTKSIYLRAKFSGRWFDEDGETPFEPDPNDNVVTWYLDSGDENWVSVDENTWYYNNAINGSYSEADVENRTVKLNFKVKLDGPGTGNQYQGKKFKLSTEFEAIQSSNGAVDTWAGHPFDNE